jgi:hypothetical protein
MKHFPRPTGHLQGDDRPMRDAGTGTGVTDTYGADLGGTSSNRIGSMNGTGSDPMDQCMPTKKTTI